MSNPATGPIGPPRFGSIGCPFDVAPIYLNKRVAEHRGKQGGYAEMPVYEYVCTSCEYEFEMLARSMSDRDEARCPKCHGVKVQRKLSVFAARSGAAKSSEFSGGGACGRCGDPNGPCSI